MRANRRPKWRSAILAVAMLVSTSLLVLGSANPAHADPECEDHGVYVLFARGSTAKLGSADQKAFLAHLHYLLPDATWAELGNIDGSQDDGEDPDSPSEYPAAILSTSSTYGASVEIGARELITHLNQRYGNGPGDRNCYSETVILGGHSQGADAIGWALEWQGPGGLSQRARSHIGYAALYGDPRYNRGCFVDRWWTRGDSDERCDANGVLFARYPYARSEYRGRFGSWCSDGDGFCNGSWNMGNHADIYRQYWYQQSAAEIAAAANLRLQFLNAVNPDFGGDQRGDLAWHQGTDLRLFSSQGGGTFGYSGSTGGIGAPGWAGAGDVNGDNRVEVIYHQGTTLNVFRWSGGNWQLVNQTPGIGPADYGVVGDFSGDGRADIAWHQGSILQLFAGMPNGTFSYLGGTGGIGTPSWGGAGDVNGDSQDEVVWYEGNTLSTFSWLGSSWRWINSTSGVGPANNVAVGDFNGDSRADLAWQEGTNLHLLGGLHNGRFSYEGYTGNIGPATWGGATDINNDKLAELVWYQGTTVHTFRWSGGTWYYMASTANIGAPTYAVTSG